MRRVRLAQLRLALRALTLEHRVNLLDVRAIEPLLERLREIVADVGDGTPHCAQHAGIGRNQLGADADFADQRGAMHRSRAAERHHRELPRIEALLDRDEPDPPRHAQVHDGEHGFRRSLDAEAQPFAEFREGAAGIFEVERYLALAADRAVHGDAAENQVGIGYGRLGPAAPIADRAGHRSRAARPDLQNAAAVDRRDAAAAGADGVHVDHRQAQRHAEVEVRLFGDARLAVDHDRDVEAGAAHVAR